MDSSYNIPSVLDKLCLLKFSVFCCFDLWGLADPRGTVPPPQAGQFLEMAGRWRRAVASVWKWSGDTVPFAQLSSSPLGHESRAL